MIELYFAPTPNGLRAAIMLCETGLPYQAHRVHFDNKPAALLELNPAGTIPVLVDPQGPDGERVVVAQSVAILWYLARKIDRFWPEDPRRQRTALQWLMQAASDVAGASGAFFVSSFEVPEKSEANTKVFADRLVAAFAACDQQLKGREYLADEVSIADFALYPFVRKRWALIERAGNLPHLVSWAERIGARPAVARAMEMG